MIKKNKNKIGLKSDENKSVNAGKLRNNFRQVQQVELKAENSKHLDENLVFEYQIKIPYERIAVLIGRQGGVKRKIEHELGVRLKIDSKEGDVVISGEDSFNLLKAQNIVKAIARGFNPEIALTLADENYIFETIDLGEYSGKSKKKLIRLRGRAIGMEGRSREIIEGLTNTHVIIFGKTLAIIGSYESVALCRKAFESLLAGARHATVYAWLEKQKDDLKKAGMF